MSVYEARDGRVVLARSGTPVCRAGDEMAFLADSGDGVVMSHGASKAVGRRFEMFTRACSAAAEAGFDDPLTRAAVDIQAEMVLVRFPATPENLERLNAMLARSGSFRPEDWADFLPQPAIPGAPR